MLNLQELAVMARILPDPSWGQVTREQLIEFAPTVLKDPRFDAPVAAWVLDSLLANGLIQAAGDGYVRTYAGHRAFATSMVNLRQILTRLDP
jgi:hypothetical protein